MRPVVYVASPYTLGNPELNVEFQCRIFDQLLRGGKVWPIAPLWSHWQSERYHVPYEMWMEFDLAMATRYDACLRLSASIPEVSYYEYRSSGADREVARYQSLGKPVFYNIEDLYRWVELVPEVHYAISGPGVGGS